MPNGNTPLLYPTVTLLREIEQVKLPFIASDSVLKNLFPIVEEDTHLVEWEQMDNYTGLMGVRGLDAEGGRVKPKGVKRYMMEPGVYGDHMLISEADVTKRKAPGNDNRPIDVNKLVFRRSEQLIHRQVARQLWIVWQLMLYGKFYVSHESGAILHTDSYPQTVYNPTVLWSDPANSTPLQDLRNIKLLARGKSTNFGASSRLKLNQYSFNLMAANRNTNDLFGQRTQGLQTPLTLAEANAVLAGEDLPQIEIYETSYQDDTDTTQMYLPNGYGQLVGVRDSGAPVGQFTLTRNYWTPNHGPGAYYKITEGRKPGEPPLRIDRGFNGGVEIHYPGSLVTLKVA